MFFLERVISNDAEIDRLREEIASLVGQNLQRQQGQGLSKQTKRHIAKGIAGLVQDDCMRKSRSMPALRSASAVAI